MAEEVASKEQISPVDAFLAYAREELEKVRNRLNEIGLLVGQNQGEVDKLVERNVSIAAEVHHMQAGFDTIPREDIRSIYEKYQDSQQRLFTMRGQLENLISDKEILEEFFGFLKGTVALLDQAQGLGVAVRKPVGSSVIRQIITAQEDERRKISRQIHDGPAQGLTNIILQAEIALRLFDLDQDKARQELADLQKNAGLTFGKLRDYIFDLRPMMLDDLGLIPTIRRYIGAFGEKTGLEIIVEISSTDRRLESHIEVLVFRGLQEVLATVRDHAQATQVKVKVDVHEKQVRTVIEDNGKGFKPQTGDEATDSGQSRGLRELHNRIGQIGGTIEVQSSPGQGTRVVFSIPTQG
jgi:two-component system sensor histidine kinase DegS